MGEVLKGRPQVAYKLSFYHIDKMFSKQKNETT